MYITEVFPRPTGRVGLYIHVPFCARHCPYCDFTVVVTARPPFEQFAAAVIAEIEDDARNWDDRTLHTIYFGGGTPSMLPPKHVRDILHVIGDRFAPHLVREITIEANPEHASAQLLDAWLEAGVTRVSWGAQSFDNTTLAALGRVHTAEQARAAIEMSRTAGFAHISADLIFAVPGRSIEHALADVRAISAIAGLDHVSSYELTWEPRTSMTRRLRAGLIEAHSEDDRVEIFDAMRAELRRAGFERYEVSNFARPGGSSEHNAAYWQGHEYAAYGPGAHGMRIDLASKTVQRTANTTNWRQYLADGGRTRRAIEALDGPTHLGECAMLAARTAGGLSPRALSARFGADVGRWLEPLCKRWALDGLGRWDGETFSPSDRGFDLADTLAVQILSALDIPEPN